MISVNGTPIGDDVIAREVQHHPAPSREEAEQAATTALVLRELLLQRAGALGLGGADEEELLASLIETEVSIPDPTTEEIARYYRRNSLRFTTPALFEAAHIFFPARETDEDKRAEARAKAEAVLELLLADPARFADLARDHSACSSKEQGGSLGQVSRGDTNPELQKALSLMEEGTIAPQPIASRHGFHLLRLDRKALGRTLPLEQVDPWIRDHLRKSSRRRAIAQYLQLLAGQARIEGFDLAGATSPLVQ